MYNFIEKASRQPDLQETTQYLTQIVDKLEDIKERIKNTKRFSEKLEVADIAYTCDRIILSHLPELIDQYCDFTLKFRNETVVKTEVTQKGQLRYTTKDLLLKDLSHLMEEAIILENHLNENNLSDFLGKSRLVTDNFGVKPEMELNLEGNLEVEHEHVTYDNKFNYQDFIKTNPDTLFKKPAPLSKPVEVLVEKIIAPAVEKVIEPEESLPVETVVTEKRNSTSLLVVSGIMIALCVIFVPSLFHSSAPVQPVQITHAAPVTTPPPVKVVAEGEVYSQLMAINKFIKGRYQADYTKISFPEVVGDMKGVSLNGPNQIVFDNSNVSIDLKKIGNKAYALVINSPDGYFCQNLIGDLHMAGIHTYTPNSGNPLSCVEIIQK